MQNDEYDYVLVALPASLLAGGFVWLYGALAPALALALGSLLAVVPLLYALFLSPPV